MMFASQVANNHDAIATHTHFDIVTKVLMPTIKSD